MSPDVHITGVVGVYTGALGTARWKRPPNARSTIS